MSRRTDWELPAMPLRPKVGVVGLSSPLEVGAEQAPIAAAEVAQVLAEAGIEALDVGAFADADESALAGRRLAEAHVDAIVGVATSWYEDYLVLDLLEEWPVPLLLWSIPAMETGALCGSQQLTCFLRHLEFPYRRVFGYASDAPCNERAVGYLRAAALHRRLRRARVGIAGSRVGGMTHTAPAEFMLKRAIGPRVEPLDIPGVLCRAQGICDETSRWL